MTKVTEALNEPVIDRRDEKIAKLEADLRSSRSNHNRVVKERDEALDRLEAVGRIESKLIVPPKWAAPRLRTGKPHHATVNLMLSDLHLDEVVNPEEMDWVNAYNRQIAHQRLTAAVDNTILLADEYFTGLKYDGMVLAVGGDTFSGDIHEELSETNVDTIMGTVEYWEDYLAAAVERLASAFGNLYVPITYGNHGRNTKRMRYKKFAKTNFEWLAWHHIAKHFKGSKHITWNIPLAAQTHFQTYHVKYLMVHGNEFRGGDGITGPLRPILLGHQRKTRRQVTLQQPYDLMLIGHWHKYLSLPGMGVLMNGSLKGYDEFAAGCNFEPEPAQQAFWLTTPEHGVTFQAPVIVQKREVEGW